MKILKFASISLFLTAFPVNTQLAYSDQPPFMDGMIVPGEGDPKFAGLFNQHCSVCHGEKLLGTGQGPALVGGELRHGDSIPAIINSVSTGSPTAGMPAWQDVLSQSEIDALGRYIAEARMRHYYAPPRQEPIDMPAVAIKSERHEFKIETFADGLDRLPFAIEPLPDGRWLLVEKLKGLSVLSKDGVQSNIIRQAPIRKLSDSLSSAFLGGSLHGIGWMFDVELHPEYELNGWIYLQFSDVCTNCNNFSRKTGHPVSMSKVVRGRLRDGAWVDEETIWQTSFENYTATTDMASGGRLALDDSGHLFFGVGQKGPGFYSGIQNLSLPYGKLFRLNDDGSIPEDNPFHDHLKPQNGIWAYGFRSPVGLQHSPETGELWLTDMGPRGGDELNLITRGGNYGWPLYSKGMHYDGSPVNQGDALGIEWKLENIVQPVLDLTPAPAINNFVFYDANEFSEWKNDVIVGTLASQQLFRLVIKNKTVVHQEELLNGLGRIRDIEIASNGEIYLLIENITEGQIVRLINPQDLNTQSHLNKVCSRAHE